jgi:NADH-quinone oxidoreductase subunit A
MPTNYTELYFPVLLQVLVAIALAGGLVGASALLGHRVKNAVKNSPYESGMIPIGTARERFSVKFYLVAMVFILFDIEAIFLYPWAVVYRELNRDAKAFGVPLFGFLEMFVFVVLVLAGFFYIWKKGVLDWAAEEPDTVTPPGLTEQGKAAIEAGTEVEALSK